MGFVNKSQRLMQLSCQKKTSHFFIDYNLDFVFVCFLFVVTCMPLKRICSVAETSSTLEHMILMTRFCSLFFGHQTLNLLRHYHIYVDSRWVKKIHMSTMKA